MSHQNQTKKLGKLLTYMLARQPDAFGLVPDATGFFKIKDVLKALHEDGLRSVRLGSLKELSVSLASPPIELTEKFIRACGTVHYQATRPAQNLPKLLFTAIRRRAHRHVAEKGLFPSEGHCVTLAADPEMAKRIGGRTDADPVLLTVNVAQAEGLGVYFNQFGEALFLCDFLPHGCFTAPALPKEKPEDKKQAPQKVEPPVSRHAGSYFIDFNMDPEEKKQIRLKRRRQQAARDKDRRRQKKQKRISRD